MCLALRGACSSWPPTLQPLSTLTSGGTLSCSTPGCFKRGLSGWNRRLQTPGSPAFPTTRVFCRIGGSIEWWARRLSIGHHLRSSHPDTTDLAPRLCRGNQGFYSPSFAYAYRLGMVHWILREESWLLRGNDWSQL